MTMTSQRCYSRVLFLLVFIAFRCNEGTVFFASAQGHFNQQPKPQTPGNHRSSQPASSPPPYPPLPSQESQERVSATPENYSYCGAKGSFGSAKLLLPSFKNKLHLLASRKRPDWSASAQATTRLSGGADSPNENSQFSDKSSSQADPVVQDGNKKQKAFLGGFRPQKSMLPKVLKGKTGADLAKKVKEGVAMVQETSAQVVPSFLTVLSLIWTADKGISFFTLYGISLLGASCGFYMFLYFITVGYALGVTLPLLVALYAYNVRASFLMWMGLYHLKKFLVGVLPIIPAFIASQNSFSRDILPFCNYRCVGSPYFGVFSLERVYKLACPTPKGGGASI